MIRVGDFPIGDAEKRAVERVLTSGRVSEHKEVSTFEKRYAEFVGATYCVACSSGWAALVLAIKAWMYLKHIPLLARVRVPALTYIATASAVEFCGLEPCFVDVRSSDLTMDATSPTYDVRDIVLDLPVSLLGFPCDAPATPFIEDGCEAHGAKDVGRRGIATAFSFYIAHNIQAGELGCVTTNDREMYLLMRSLKAQGRACACDVCLRSEGKCPVKGPQDPRFAHNWLGFNFKASEITCALANSQLDRAAENIAKRRENYERLYSGLSDINEIGLIAPKDGYAPMVFPILRHSAPRTHLMEHLHLNGIETRPLFGCIPTQQRAYSSLAPAYRGDLPVSERWGAQGFYVGCHQYLKDWEIEAIICGVKGGID